MKWLLSLFGVSPYLILAVIAAGAGLFFFGRYEGGSAQRESDKAALADALAHQVVVQKAADQITLNVSTAADLKLQALNIVTIGQIQEITRYVSPKADLACTVPRGFVRLHDAAAAGVPVPDATGQSDDAAAGIDLVAVASTTASNYGRCNAALIKLKALQDWAAQQKALQP